MSKDLQTSESSTPNPSGEQLTFFRAASPAKILVTLNHGQQTEPTRKTESTEQEVDCGLNISESSANQDQNGWSRKTSRHSRTKDSTSSYKRLPTSGIMQNGQLYQPLTLVRHTYEKEFGLWLTPSASDGTKRASFSAKSLSKRFDKHPNGNLAEQYAKLTGKRLCPNLLEYMMGYPGNYTMLNE